LEYQPQFSLATGALVGVEALARWNHPTLGLVGPNRFIPVAEETGHIVPLGRWVIEKACEQGAEWSRSGGAGLTVSVNLSGRQLQDRNLLDDVRTTLSLSGLAARQLVLEITESVLIADTRRSLQVLTDLKTIGVSLSIDDFGTGYSSLSSLRRMPVDELKIDRSFVDSLVDTTGEGAAFVTTIIRLAQNLGLRTVAEGIEHRDQEKLLTELGCDIGQGFLLARPLQPEAITRMIRSSRDAGRTPIAGRRQL
jgi:EAL domain-containing protein (putative c-di-GMP-specific phosphodiesterase class I)